MSAVIKCSDRVLCDACGRQLCYVDCLKQCKIEGSYLSDERRTCVDCSKDRLFSREVEDDVEEMRRKV